MADKIHTVILAAGKGTRLNIETPKPLLNIMGLKLVDYPIRCALELKSLLKSEGSICVVTGHENEKVEAYLTTVYKDQVSFALQKEQKGTGDALKCYLDHQKNLEDEDFILVLCADTPLLQAQDLQSSFEKLKKNSWDAIAASFNVANPLGYGRMVCKSKGFRIIEEKDATDEQRNIKEVNSGVYLINVAYLKKYITELNTDNSSGEFYLTDLFQENRSVGIMNFSDSASFSGVNTLSQLEFVEQKLRALRNKSLQESGVTIINSDSTYIDEDINVGAGSVIQPNVFIQGKTNIGSNCIIETGCVIKDTILEDGVHVKANSYLEDSKVSKMSKVGPMAHLRPGSVIGENTKIGNFVEIKKSNIDSNVSISHLSYVGDAQVGEGTNIGCGFITCNYDGAQKHKTSIGKNSFIGSDTQVIAPLSIGDNAYVASGSTINKDVPSESFAIARTRQENKIGMAKRFIKKKS